MTKNITMLSAAVLFAASSAFAAPITSDYAPIKQVDTYSGDTIVFLEKNPAGCEQGFWMRPTHEGFKENLDGVTKAVHSNARVKVSGNSDEMWPQMELNRCRLDTLEVEPVAHVPPSNVIDTTDPKALNNITDPSAVNDPLVTRPAPPPSKTLDPIAPKK